VRVLKLTVQGMVTALPLLAFVKACSQGLRLASRSVMDSEWRLRACSHVTWELARNAVSAVVATSLWAFSGVGVGTP
jgi:hypothetical protein